MESPPQAFSSGPQTSTRGLKTRPQPSLDAKKRFCKNACFPGGKQWVFEGRVAKLRSEHPPFFALRPPPRAIWTGISSRDPWGTPLPQSTKNKKKRVFLFFLLSSLFSLLSSLCPRSRQRSPQRAGWPRKGSAPPWRPHLGTFGGLFWGFVSLLSFLFALRSSLFSLLLVVVVL